jgi:uncharacterized membrane protein YidH (DUF202 family)
MRTILGVVLVAVGVIGLIMGGISWTQQETVLEMGPVEITAQEERSLPVPPLVGGLALAAGVVLLLGARKR